MQYSNCRLCLDIQAAGSGVVLSAKKGDTGRKLFITLTDGGRPYMLSQDCYGVFTALKPDGHIVFHECTVEDNTVVCKVREQTVAVAGEVRCEIRLYGANGMLLTSACFTLAVDETVYTEGDEIESTDDFSALTALITQNQTLRTELLALKAQLEGLKGGLEQGGSSGGGGTGGGSSVKIGEATLYAAAWVGEDSPYSQILNVEGVTLNSQVDLKPSVEQMAVFYQKDLTLLTENDGGVVTVYAIGQKPVGDYTLQVSITEVTV